MQEDLRAVLVTAGLPRVVWNTRPQGSALPATVLTVVSEETIYTYRDAGNLISSRVQVDIYAGTYGDAVTADRLLVSAISGYSGTVGDTEFLAVFLESRFDATETPAAGSAPIHRISRDLMVKHKET